ncbi:hypothetical protein B9T13_10060 [Wohlfahrtiimonas chitiniclastica]|uniref:hypothetical protein n=1 Tax=Wohlfahrtiimonas chitiniclastica TaxID=400946 RepID=UPI000B989DA2|nr:hypothetical protein [Wohlfahrtiimonas chitiniclastica]OYQ69133.1 hypothetical protein B9T13_10060 [Wohlfahrtiimonas chitiniclastica]
MTNETFCSGDPFWANACVGNNGVVNYIVYAEGFSKAANILLQYILNTNGKGVDSFIYPVCFNMRHSSELRLKGAVEELSKLSVLQYKELPKFDLEGSHDIGDIWNYYKEQSEYLDERFKKINAFMEQTILDIANIDPTGQTFRYPYSTDKEKHLAKQSIINCVVLYEKFNALEQNFGRLYDLTNELVDEYKLGSFTKKLSRSQIFKLAKDLPMRDQWAGELDRELLKKKYSLSSNKDFYKAIDIIIDHYETSALIGIRKNLIALDDGLIKYLCDIWVKFNPEFRGLYNQELDFDSLDDRDSLMRDINEIKRRQKLKDYWRPILMKKLTKEHVADLMALYYFARDDLKYSENYLKFYDSFKNDLIDNETVLDKFDHVFSKPEFLVQIVIALFFLYQTDLAEELASKYLLEDCTDRVTQAKTRELFVKWEYLDYSI